MSFLKWLQRSAGRFREGAKRHLISSAQVLKLNAKTIDLMLSLPNEECEALFLREIEKYRGGAVDWRARSGEILEVAAPFLNPEERSLLAGANLNESWRLAETVQYINGLLVEMRHAIRALDTFGDSVFIVVIDTGSKVAFDEANKYWLL